MNELNSHFLNQWRLNATSSPLDLTDDDSEAVPSELDTFHSSGMFSIVLPDKLTVKYPTAQLHGHDVGVVQANKPAPVKRLVYYFEMFVKNAGVKGQIAIGFTTEGFKGKMRRQPGLVIRVFVFLSVLLCFVGYLNFRSRSSINYNRLLFFPVFRCVFYVL